MYRLFDKHGTKFLAVIGSLLMLAFILPSNWTNRGQGTARFGKLDGHEIDADAVHSAQDALRSLSNVIVMVPDRQGGSAPQPAPLSQAMFGGSQELLHDFESNPVQWYLLVREAERGGSVPDEATVENALGGQTQLRTDDGRMLPMKDINPTIRDGYAAAFRESYAVVRYFQRAARSLKVSEPEINDSLAKKFQQMKIRAVPFDATAFAAQVTPPTDDALNTQFKAYADVVPGETPTNPFGFGYRIPARATLQWITLPDAEVARAVQAGKSDELWDEEAIIYYQKNLNSFQTATTQPTTKPFADAKADVLKQVREPQIESTKRAITTRITQQMQSDAKAVNKTGPTTQQALAGVTAYGVPYGSFDYLQKLSDDIQKQFHVKLTIVNQATPLSREQLQASNALGMTYTDDGNAGADYLFSALAALNPTGGLAIGLPSKTLTSESGVNIVRAVAAEPAHAPASLNDVRAQVENDVRQQSAFALAAKAAAQAVTDAQKAGDFAKVASLKPLTSDWFGETTDKIAGLTGADAYASQLIQPSFEALRGISLTTQLPAYSVAKLQHQGVAVALEVLDVKTTLSTEDAGLDRLRIADLVQQDLARSVNSALAEQGKPPLVTDWFSFDAVSQRMAYVPDASMKKAEAPTGAPTQQPGSPFIPG